MSTIPTACPTIIDRPVAPNRLEPGECLPAAAIIGTLTT